MNKPLVSIIIPVYNAEQYIAETIASALAQTWLNTEIIIVDDGSADQSLAIAKQYESKQVKVFTQDNKGASVARNKGLSEAKGDYIQFLDADDLLSPDKINGQVLLLEQNPGRVAICSTVHFQDKASYKDLLPLPYEESFLFNDDDPAHFLISLWGGYTKNGSMITIHSWLTPKLVIDKAGSWNESLSLDDDGEFFARVVLSSKGISKSNGICYYRKYLSSKNLSSQKNIDGFNSRIKALLLKKNLLLSVNNSFEAQASIYKALTNLAVDTYLIHSEIYKKAVSELPKININYTPSTGAKASDMLADVFGWKVIKFFKIFKVS